MIEAEDGQGELLFSKTINGLRDLVLRRIGSNPAQSQLVDEMFDRLMDREIIFAKQWLTTMHARIHRAAA